MTASTFKLNPKLATFLTPSPFAVQFMIKGIVAMAAALYITILLDYDRPYWSLISAIFLQIRPESGQVIEKGICQLIGNLGGGVLGLTIIAFFVQAPPLAFAMMAIIVFILSMLSSMTSNMNVTYLCAMAAIVMVLVVAISVSSNVTSDHIFEIAIQRVSEISIGAICATLSSMLLWPQRVHLQMAGHARTLFEQTLDSMQIYLDPQDKAKERHESLLSVINALLLLESDANPVVFEGPAGPGRARAAHLLSQRTLSLIAEMQVLGHFIRDHPDWMDEMLLETFEALRQVVSKVRQESDPGLRRQYMDDFRKWLKTQGAGEQHTALQHRAIQAVSDVAQLIIVMDEAVQAVVSPRNRKLKAARLSRYHDVLSCMIIGLRSTIMFGLGVLLWIGTGWSVAFLLMILPVVFSIMFANMPTIMMLKNLLKGMTLSIPVYLLINGLILSAAPSFYEIFILVFCAPMVVILFGFTYRPTLAISLGFCLTAIIMTMPGNHMNFNIASALERGIAMLLGVSILYPLFLLIKNPSSLIMRRRLISSTSSDLAVLSLRSGDNALSWFNGRMVTRIQHMATFEDNAPGQRNLIEQGLLGLNLGHVIIKQAHQLMTISRNPQLPGMMRRWQEALAVAYRSSAWGLNDDREFLELSSDIYHLMRHDRHMDETRLKRFEGLCYRIAISLRRNAGASESQIDQLQKVMIHKGIDTNDPEVEAEATAATTEEVHSKSDTKDGSLGNDLNSDQANSAEESQNEKASEGESSRMDSHKNNVDENKQPSNKEDSSKDNSDDAPSSEGDASDDEPPNRPH
ncbi:p-hydroxybenzoic acid efflux pump subunit AaeB [Halomonadaceae bacterium LMG 33818]|uniref:FUSC family protein n=1 Tax=Cernens ardua TaxID=3402176 RepID=UPI003EDB7D1D